MQQRLLLALSLLLGLYLNLSAQKSVHIPYYLQNPATVDGSQFSWDKTYASDNFILIWGNTVGTNPAVYADPDLRFDPVAVLDTMEFIYDQFKLLGFLDDSPGTQLSQYKIVIVMYGTWGPDGAQGWANGGDADGVIGAFWVHPNGIRDGGVAAHEFAHSMQAQNNIDYRAANGLGGAWYNAGIFWETHANYMRNLIYPPAVGAWGMDVYHLETWGDWKNTYENYALLMAIQHSEGPEMVTRLWRESDSYEYPLQTYKRISGYTQARFNDSLYHYARRMATYDFPYRNLGFHFRKYRRNDLMYSLQSMHSTFNILKKIPGSDARYQMPVEQAPEEYAYNVIPLYPDNDSCAVIVKFKGHTEANTHAGWRYGFVSAHADGTLSRYSPTYAATEAEVYFQMQDDEAALYFVVMGAPWDDITTGPNNDTWKGYPKHFRFPYELSIHGALPEGHQPPEQFRTAWKTDGHLHANGGGWVQNSASVDNSVYVGPHAMVLGNAQITGNVRIDHTAVVHNALLTDQVQVLDNAMINGGSYYGQAVVQGHAYAENLTMSGQALVGMRPVVINYDLSGTVEVGGDVIVYNENGACDNGVHYRLTNYYDNKLLECDGRTAEHPDNKDVNQPYNLFTDAQMAIHCTCSNLENCGALTAVTSPTAMQAIQVFPNPTTGHVQLQWTPATLAPGARGIISLYDAQGKCRWQQTVVPADGQAVLALENYPAGVYWVTLQTNGYVFARQKVVVTP
jgi:hypothetical protein